MSTEENIVLPSVTVNITDGTKKQELELTSFKTGIILYFYPKDNTAGCSVQAEDFSNHIADFSNLGYTVIGISRDSIESHDKFIAKKELAISLISDTEEVLCKHFDVIREKNMYGKKTLGIHRSTFIFDSEGKLIHVMRNVRAKGHVDRVLNLVS